MYSGGGHTESTRLVTWPGVITWTLGCTFGILLFDAKHQALISVGG